MCLLFVLFSVTDSLYVDASFFCNGSLSRKRANKLPTWPPDSHHVGHTWSPIVGWLAMRQGSFPRSLWLSQCTKLFILHIYIPIPTLPVSPTIFSRLWFVRVFILFPLFFYLCDCYACFFSLISMSWQLAWWQKISKFRFLVAGVSFLLGNFSPVFLTCVLSRFFYHKSLHSLTAHQSHWIMVCSIYLI